MRWTAADVTMLRAVIRQAKQSLNDTTRQLEKVETQAEKMIGKQWAAAESEETEQMSLSVVVE